MQIAHKLPAAVLSGVKLPKFVVALSQKIHGAALRKSLPTQGYEKTHGDSTKTVTLGKSPDGLTTINIRFCHEADYGAIQVHGAAVSATLDSAGKVSSLKLTGMYGKEVTFADEAITCSGSVSRLLIGASMPHASNSLGQILKIEKKLTALTKTKE